MGAFSEACVTVKWELLVVCWRFHPPCCAGAWQVSCELGWDQAPLSPSEPPQPAAAWSWCWTWASVWCPVPPNLEVMTQSNDSFTLPLTLLFLFHPHVLAFSKYFWLWRDTYLQNYSLPLCHLSAWLSQIYFFLVMLILLHIHYSCWKQADRKLNADSNLFPSSCGCACGCTFLSALILPRVWKWFCKFVCQTGLIMIKYILRGCVSYLLRWLWVSYRYWLWRCYLHYHAIRYPSFKQDKLVGREFSTACPVMVPCYSAAVCFGETQDCFDTGRASYSKAFQQRNE